MTGDIVSADQQSEIVRRLAEFQRSSAPPEPYWVWNTSSAIVPIYGVLGIDGPHSTYNPSTSAGEKRLKNHDYLHFDGSAPDPDSHSGGKWCVVVRRAPIGKSMQCEVHGVVPTRVYINGADDQYCDVVEGHTDGDYTCYLGTGATGAQILRRENAESGAGTVVWAIVRLGNHTGPITGQLKTSLTPGGTAEMYLTKPDGTIIDESTPLTVTVKDTIGDKRSIGKDDRSAGGAVVLAEVLADGTVAIVDIQQQAKRCSAILAADAGPGVSVNVDNVVPLDGGMSPVNSSSDTLSAAMPPAARALDNAVCVIEWDETTDTWKIDGGYLHQQAKRIRGTLGGALSTTTASQTVSSPTSIDGGQVPSGTLTAHNVYTTAGFEGDSGGVCAAEWNETTDRYEFYDVECPAPA